MIKTIKIIGLLLVISSCNSNEKKKMADTAYNNETSQIEASIKRGKIVYDDMCITCHMANGEGVPRAFPPIAGSDYLKDNQNGSIKAVKYGMSGEIIVNGITYNGAMSPLGLSDKEIADVMNYINNSWGNTIDNLVTPDKVSEL
ncbi:MAG: cytochrome c [Winogradskyella sp.]|nr:cytochrome c [Winogradskyella sp.]